MLSITHFWGEEDIYSPVRLAVAPCRIAVGPFVHDSDGHVRCCPTTIAQFLTVHRSVRCLKTHVWCTLRGMYQRISYAMHDKLMQGCSDRCSRTRRRIHRMESWSQLRALSCGVQPSCLVLPGSYVPHTPEHFHDIHCWTCLSVNGRAAAEFLGVWEMLCGTMWDSVGRGVKRSLYKYFHIQFSY